MPKSRKVVFNVDKINEAIKAVLLGTCSRVDIDKTAKVYECKNIIRIDLKITEEE